MKENLELAHETVSKLLACGVRQVVVCAGSFNSPFIAIFSKISGLKIVNHFEERSAAFFALGLCKQLNQPVAICVTSGTAVAECLAAMIEAHYESLPLIVISADRETNLSGSGYPQAIRQNELLYSHCSLCLDVSGISDLKSFPTLLKAPAHINVRFKEPILKKEFQIKPLELPPIKTIERIPGKTNSQINNFLQSFKRPLVIAGKVEAEYRSKMETFLVKLKAPVIAEALSGLRESKALEPYLLRTNFLSTQEPSFDCVLRIGSVPTSDLWRSLERDPKFQSIPVCSISSEAKYPGLSRACICLAIEQENFLSENQFTDQKWSSAVLEKDRIVFQQIRNLFVDYPLSEAAMLNWLSKQIPQNSFVYLGNSLPIREWNQFADLSNLELQIDANRGANGIDGQIASFLGAASASTRVQNWAIIGDLTFLYDCNSLCLAKEIKNFQIVVINNGGGKIFESLPYYDSLTNSQAEKDNFLNAHCYNCSRISESFGVKSQQIREQKFEKSLSEQMLIELLPCPRQTREFGLKYSEVLSQAL